MLPRQYKKKSFIPKSICQKIISSDRGVDLVGLLVGHGGGERQPGGGDRPDHQDETVFFPSFRC